MTRLTAQHRRAMILAEARLMSLDGQLYQWGMSDIAKRCNCAKTTVGHYYSGAGQIRNEVIGYAIIERDLDILAQAIAAHDPAIIDIDLELRAAAVASLDV